MLHYREYDFSNRCSYCATPRTEIAKDTPEEEEWLNSPESCFYANPIGLEVFEEEGAWTKYGFVSNRVKINDADLADRISRVTPLVCHDGKLYSIELPDLRGSAFTWVDKQAAFEGFQECIIVPTFHSCGAPALFKPSIAEVLAQMPVMAGETLNAFYIDTSVVKCCSDGSGHLAKTHWGKIDGIRHIGL